MTLVVLGPEHVEAVARLHCVSLTGLLASLGLRAARAFYSGATRVPQGVGFVCIGGGEVLGHVFGSAEPDRLRAEVLRVNRLEVLAGLCAGVARRPSLLWQLFRGRRGPDEGSYDSHQPELTYLAVAPESRGTGIGRQLVDAFGEAMRQTGASGYELSVDEANRSAIVFYERLGFRLVRRYREFGTLHRRYRLEFVPS